MITADDSARIALLRPELRAIVPDFIATVEQATGKQVRIPPRGLKRSYADQLALWNDRANNPYPVAQPGTSRHEKASAIDINIIGGTDADYETAAQIAEQFYGLEAGLYFNQRYGTRADKVHFQLRETQEEASRAYALMLPGDPTAPATGSAIGTTLAQVDRKTWIIAGVVGVGILLLLTDEGD